MYKGKKEEKMIKKNLNKTLSKVLSVGLSTAMILQPVTAVADTEVPVEEEVEPVVVEEAKAEELPVVEEELKISTFAEEKALLDDAVEAAEEPL